MDGLRREMDWATRKLPVVNGSYGSKTDFRCAELIHPAATKSEAHRSTNTRRKTLSFR
jgi:DNA-damage-inducible protein J